VLLAGCGEQERAACSAWEGPVELEQIVREPGHGARHRPPCSARASVVQRLHPSDAAHVLGLCGHWCGEAARLGALLWARQMRRLFASAIGRNGARGPQPVRVQRVSRQISRALIEAGLTSTATCGRERQPDRAARGFSSSIRRVAAAPPACHLASGSLFHLRFCGRLPGVAVGAPASTFFPDATGVSGSTACRNTRTSPMPMRAVMGSVVQRAQVTVTRSAWPVHRACRPRTAAFRTDLRAALARAERLTGAQAAAWAGGGAADCEVRLEQAANHVPTSTASCSWRPASPPPPPAGRRWDA